MMEAGGSGGGGELVVRGAGYGAFMAVCRFLYSGEAHLPEPDFTLEVILRSLGLTLVFLSLMSWRELSYNSEERLFVTLKILELRNAFNCID